MKKKLAITIFCLVLSVLSYSQIELIDNKGDTLVCITIPQMDRIYIELIQKDSLLEQSKINRALQFKYIQIIDSTQKDIESLKTSVNSLKSKNTDLFNESQKNRSKLIRTRKVGLIMVGIIILQALL